jgi:MFS transporter, PPP family, 3-phenylpropionic acid transporter
VNPRLLASIFYFFYFAAGGALVPFLNLYYQEVGMSTRQIGVLAALPTITVLAAGPFWGVVADGLHLHKRLLPLLTFGVMVPVAGLMWAQGFVALAILVLLYAALNASIIPLADNSVLNMLGDARADYGRLRIWGAVGFGAAAFGAGVLAERLGLRAIIIVYIAMMSLAALSATRLPAPPVVPRGLFGRNLKGLAMDSRWLAFVFAMFLAGVCFSILNNYFSIYLKSIGAGEALIGLGVAVAGVSELPVFWLSPLLLRRWGPRPLVMVSLLMFAVRGYVYSLIQDPRWSVPAQLLHGSTFSLIWLSSVVYASAIAPAGLGASAQAVLGAMFMGLGAGTGALLGASVYSNFGPTMTFRVASLVALLGLILFTLSTRGVHQSDLSGSQPAADSRASGG